MKRRMFIAAVSGIALVAPWVAHAGLDENQRRLYQRMQEAQRKLEAAKAMPADEQRQKMLQDHLRFMQDAMKQMQAGKPCEGMTTQHMPGGNDEHMKQMNRMKGRMMEEHHMMMMGK